MVSNNKIYWPHPLPFIWARTRAVARKTRKNMGPYLMGWGTCLHMTNKGWGAKCFLCLYYPDWLSGISVPRDHRKGWNQEDGLFLENNQVQIREYINQLKISKSMDPDRVYSQTLKELAGVIVMSLLTIFDGSFQEWRRKKFPLTGGK